MGGSKPLCAKVAQYAGAWGRYANVYLNFGDDPQAKIRASFTDDGQSHSLIGQDALTAPATQSTVNFGWFNDSTPDVEIRRTAAHEFGHVLGFVHEHQNPNAEIKWNKDKVFAYFQANNNWTQDQVITNIFQAYSKDSTNASAFDPRSIMLYSFPAELTLDGFSVPSHTEISEMDKRFAARLYPWTPHALVTIANETTVNVPMEYQWEGDQTWRSLFSPLQSQSEELFWHATVPNSPPPALTVRYHDNLQNTAALLATVEWRPDAIDDYPDFTRGARYAIINENRRLVIVKR